MSEIKTGKLQNPIPFASKIDSSVAANSKEARDPKMLAAARSFENQFLRQIVGAMRKTVPKDELIEESMTENLFKEQLDGEYVDKWVDGGGIGLADMLYTQLNERYGHPAHQKPVLKGEVLPLPQQVNHKTLGSQAPQDLLSQIDGKLFLVKKQNEDFELKSAKALTRAVKLHSPFSGLVLQSAALDDGRQMVLVKHDQGLVTRLVHNGQNKVATGTRVAAGDTIAELAPSTDGSSAHALFRLRRTPVSE
jgi:flagellar protein FlgJ